MIKLIPKQFDYILLFANIGIRSLFILFPFWGLEYEDAFIFNDTARFLNHQYDYNSTFLTQSCLDGSYENCIESGTFGGHFLTFPIILSKLNLVIGYHPSNIFFLNFIFSIALLVVVFIWNKQNENQYHFSLTSFLLLMLITPFITIFQTSGLVETFSSLLIVLFFLSIFKSNENNFKISHYSFWFSLFFLILSVITKRENLILVGGLCLIPIYRLRSRQKILPYEYLVLLVGSIVSISVFAYLTNLFSIESNEGQDIGTGTFSFTFLFENLFQNILALVDYRYWGLTGIVFLVSIAVLIARRAHTLLGTSCLIISLLYLLLYSSHYRSYYQVHYAIMSPFETLRYSVNYFPLVCIFISSLKVERIFLEKTRLVNLILIGGSLLTVVLVVNSVKTRIELDRDEYCSRIKPVEATLKVVKPNDIIISDLPIVFHCYVSDKQRIIDYYSLANAKLDDLVSNYSEGNVYLIKPKENKIDSLRYNSEINISRYCFTKIKLPLEYYELIKFCNHAVKN